MAACCLSTFVGVMVLWGLGLIKLGMMPHVALTWWLANVAGMMVIVPLAYPLIHPVKEVYQKNSRLLEMVIVAILLFIVAYIVYNTDFVDIFNHAHNAWLDTLYRTGLIGLVLVTVHFFSVVKIFSRDPRLLPLYLAIEYKHGHPLNELPGIFSVRTLYMLYLYKTPNNKMDVSSQ